jgi:hypothetical protein
MVFEKYMRQRLLVAAATVDPSPSSPKIPALFRHNRGAAGALILLTVP